MHVSSVWFMLTSLTPWGFQGDLQSAASVQAIARQVCEQLIQSESPLRVPDDVSCFRGSGVEILKTFPLYQVTWLATAPSSTMFPVHRCPSELCQDRRESPAELELQGPRENREHQADLASPVRMARTVSRENEAHPEKRVTKDLKVLGSKAPEDHRDHLVGNRAIQF